MTHSLNGKTFFQYKNKGVTALVSGDVLRDIDRRLELINFEIAARGGFNESDVRAEMEVALAHFVTTPIFTFIPFEKDKVTPVTGSMSLLHHLQKYIQVNGGAVSVGRSFHVPFSNGPHNYDYQYATSYRQFEETFGVTPAFLMKGFGS